METHLLKQQKGFQDELILVNGDRGLGISVWEDRSSADTCQTATFPTVHQKLTPLIEGTPRVEAYDVAATTCPRRSTPHVGPSAPRGAGGRSIHEYDPSRTHARDDIRGVSRYAAAPRTELRSARAETNAAAKPAPNHIQPFWCDS